MSDQTTEGNPLVRLATPGERLGWIFRDRNLYRRPFLEPAPIPMTVPAELASRVATLRATMPRRLVNAALVTIGLAVVGACCSSGSSLLFSLVETGVIFVGACSVVLIILQYSSSSAVLERAQAESYIRHQQAFHAWQARREAFERAQQEFVDSLVEWGAATPAPGVRRIDVIGGTSWGWEALLTVFGASLLSTHGPMMIADFSAKTLCAELIRLCDEIGAGVDLQYVPSQLAEVDLFADFDQRELVDSLVEAIHGDASSGTRAERFQDSMLLTELSTAIGDRITPARLLAGLRVLTDRPGQPALTDEECERVTGSMPMETRRQLFTRIRRVEAFLRPLEAMGSALRPRAGATVTCIAADQDGFSTQYELLKDLVVQSLIRRVTAASTAVGSVVIVGADEIDHRHIERLGDVCERRGIRLLLLFRHLRDASLRTVGGGEVVFMRLANHEEARHASEYIGRQHTFVLSGLTRAASGAETHTFADVDQPPATTGRPIGGGSAFARRRSWDRTLEASRSEVATARRVYEYAVEPRTLQDLPDYAMLWIRRQGVGSIVQAVECDPGIVLLPRATLEPLPTLPPPSALGTTGSGPPAPMPPSVFDTPAGQILKYPVGRDDFVLVDATTSDLTVSWTATCSASAFLDLTAQLADAAPDAPTIVAVAGSRLTGDARTVLHQARALEDRDVAKSCDFVRADLPAVNVAFHRMPGPEGSGAVVIVSAVLMDRSSAPLSWLARSTAAADVAATVMYVAPPVSQHAAGLSGADGHRGADDQ